MGLQLKRNTERDEPRRLFASGKEIYLDEQTQVDSLASNGRELEAGEHSFTFSIQLPDKLPSSFQGSRGCIKYKMRFTIRKAWSFDERYNVPFAVRKKMLLMARRDSIAVPVYREASKSIVMFGCKAINLSAFLPVDYAVCGESLRICANIYNNSIILVEKLRFSCLQQITYYINRGPGGSAVVEESNENNMASASHRETFVLLTKETGPVEKKSERHFDHLLQIPFDTLPSDEDCSSIIKVCYVLRVEVLLRGFFRNLVTDLPFTLFSKRARYDEPNIVAAAQNYSFTYSERSISLQSDPSLMTNSTINSFSPGQSLYESSSNSSVPLRVRQTYTIDATISTTTPPSPPPPPPPISSQRHLVIVQDLCPVSSETTTYSSALLERRELNHSFQITDRNSSTQLLEVTQTQQQELRKLIKFLLK